MRAARALSENSITSMLSLFGVKPSQLKRKRLCRLFSSVALFSATNEDYEYRVYRPLGSRNTFIVSIAVPRN